MSKVLALREENQVATVGSFSAKQVDILKNSLCRGITDDELQVFLMACQKTQLDPFMKQIYAIKRRGKKPDGSWGEVMTIQTGIDGYRLIAERTGRYAPGAEPTFEYDSDGQLVAAVAHVKKMTNDGTWHVVSASAHIDEYGQKTKEGMPMGVWGNMPRTMLAKCAESLALRRAFPAEMSGVYTKEEMKQSELQDVTTTISLEQASELETILSECEEKYRNWVYDYIRKQYNTSNLSDVPADLYDRMRAGAIKNMHDNHAKQQQNTVDMDTGELPVTEDVT